MPLTVLQGGNLVSCLTDLYGLRDSCRPSCIQAELRGAREARERIHSNDANVDENMKIQNKVSAFGPILLWDYLVQSLNLGISLSIEYLPLA